MAWTIGGYRIIVSEDGGRPETRLSEHIVLDGTESIIHNFGYGSNVRTLTAYLLDNPDDYTNIENAQKNGTTMALVSDQGSEGNYKIWTVTRQRVQDIKRTKPVWKLALELKSVT